MAEPSQGTKLEMKTGAGSAETITEIALGYPTILTSVAHALDNGDVVTLASFAGDDAADINSLVRVVKNVTTDTFAVDVDTTGKTITDNTDTATATPVEWTEIGEVTDVDRAAGSRSEIDTTHLQSTSKEYLLGLRDSGTVTFNVNWLFDDAGQLALLTAEGSDDAYDFRVTYPSTDVMTFSAYVQSVSGPSAAVDGKLSGSVTLRITGDVTFA
jgi:hypothetical protein